MRVRKRDDQRCFLSVCFVLACTGTFYVVPSGAKRFHSILGPFRIDIKSLEVCPPDVEPRRYMEWGMRDARTHYSQSPTYSGNISMPYILNDTLTAKLNVASWSNSGGWKDNAHILILRLLCTSMDIYIHQIWSQIQIETRGKVSGCPVLPGLFRFNNVTFDVSNTPVKTFLYGKWRCDAKIVFSNGEVAGCIRAYANTVPA